MSDLDFPTIGHLLNLYESEKGFWRRWFPFLTRTDGIEELIEFYMTRQDRELTNVNKYNLLSLLVARAQRIASSKHSYSNMKYQSEEELMAQKLTNYIYMVLGSHFVYYEKQGVYRSDIDILRKQAAYLKDAVGMTGLN